MPRPLEGVRVLDLSRLVAGGMLGMLLADFGADVVKVEQPGVGDPLRHWTAGGQPFWWKVYGRNKRSITLNLQSERGKELFLKLLPDFDVLVDAFIPGKMESWGLGPEKLHHVHPGLVIVRISGWGQTGPASQKPGFGTLIEAASGLAAMTGDQEGPPILPPFPAGDMFTAFYACSSVMFALYHRDVHHGPGQVIDASLFESLFSVLGPLAAEYAGVGRVRTRIGSQSVNSAPRGMFPTKDEGWIAVSASTPVMAERFLKAYGLGALLEDEKFATNEARVRHAVELNQLVAEAIRCRTTQENVDLIEREKLTATPVATIADIEQNPHWQERQLLVDVQDGARSVRMHNVTPKLSATPGEIRWSGPPLGKDNQAVYEEELGLSPVEIEELREEGVI